MKSEKRTRQKQIFGKSIQRVRGILERAFKELEGFWSQQDFGKGI